MSDLPYLELRGVSTTSAADDGKIAPARRSRRAQWRVAPPLPGSRIYGRACPVRLELTPRIGADVWIEVSYPHGRFYIRHDSSVLDLVFRVQEGGFWIHPPKGSTTRRT